MNPLSNPPILDFNVEVTLLLDRFRQAVVAEKDAITEASDRRRVALDRALIKITEATRAVSGMPSMKQAGDDDEVAEALILKRLGQHSQGDAEVSLAET